MFGKSKHDDRFFESLCVEYYEKVLRYLYSVLNSEAAARDCVQDVFLVACQKRSLLRQHPNPGGFLFQTAKNIARKTKRESFDKMLRDVDLDEDTADNSSIIENALDRQIDEQEYIETVLSRLTEEKQILYHMYYTSKKSMAEIAAMLHIEEATVRMRYVRLRREIKAIAGEIAEEYFIC